MIKLDDLLITLEKLDSYQAHIVELRFFGGLNPEEAVEVVEASVNTVRRAWHMTEA